ncbi:MAG: hypothetical protein QMD95_00740 [Candidatus Hodarchaeaceae archaeon]|nr:hypothetical protein [Candidatus Hodarchaeaceae archaeon]
MFTPTVTAGAQRGKHLGDAAPLEYEIVYTDFPGTLTIDESGATYHFSGWAWYAGGSYDEGHFGTYAVYFIGQCMSFEIRLRNMSNRTYKNLKVIAAQEYHLADGADYGAPLPGESTQEWFVTELRGGDEIVLRGRARVAYDTRPGLDQTHLQVLHWVNGNQVPLNAQLKGARADGRIFVDNQEAGIYCPPAFGLLDF